MVPHFSLFTRAASSNDSWEPSLPTVFDPLLRPLPLQYQLTGDPRTPPRRDLPRTPDQEPAPQPNPPDPDDNPFGPGDPAAGPPGPPGPPDPQGPPEDGGGGPPNPPPPGGPPVDLQEGHRHRCPLLLRTLHRVLRKSLRFLSRRHLHTRRSPMSRRQRTSLRRRSGIVSDDKPSSTSRRIDGTSTMIRRSFDSY
jgi:hypothetical protein